jgi:hypothetical protein
MNYAKAVKIIDQRKKMQEMVQSHKSHISSIERAILETEGDYVKVEISAIFRHNFFHQFNGARMVQDYLKKELERYNKMLFIAETELNNHVLKYGE